MQYKLIHCIIIIVIKKKFDVIHDNSSVYTYLKCVIRFSICIKKKKKKCWKVGVTLIASRFNSATVMDDVKYEFNDIISL